MMEHPAQKSISSFGDTLEHRPDLSITIVSYNTRELTRQCLQSVFENTRSIEFEVWVVDNDSRDGSPEMIEKEFPQVHLIRNTANVGLAAATNQGLIQSTGRYVLALNSDTVVQPEAFDILVRFMDSHPDAGAATPMLYAPEGRKHIDYCGNMMSLGMRLLEMLHALHPQFGRIVGSARTRGVDYSRTGEVPYILMGTSLIVRREAMEQVGLQDPRFFVYCEDTDWTLRIAKAGWKLYHVAEAKVLHYGGESTKQTSARMVAQLYRSRARFVQKHYGLAAGIIARLLGIFAVSPRLVKWAVLYMLRPSLRKEAIRRINEFVQSLSALVRY